MDNTKLNVDEHNIERIKFIFRIIDRSLFSIDGKLDYDGLTESLYSLAYQIDKLPPEYETESLWNYGEFGNCTLGDLIIGAYWHFTEWHEGQNSDTYKALCTLGKILSPGMSSPEDEENIAYTALNELAAS